jgi:signal-transduction protein with cAMP-binding, CBS, and nucleotidyltransferase domain
MDPILKQQIEDIEHGRPATNTVEIKRLSRRDRKKLHAALRSVESLDQAARDLLFSA